MSMGKLGGRWRASRQGAGSGGGKAEESARDTIWSGGSGGFMQVVTYKALLCVPDYAFGTATLHSGNWILWGLFSEI